LAKGRTQGTIYASEGTAVERLLGVTSAAVFGIACVAFILLQVALLIHAPVPHLLL
jgi:hypothetical protein